MRPTVSTRRTLILAERAALHALAYHEAACAMGARVHYAREAGGLSQRELGSAINRSGSTIGNVEHGRRMLTGLEQVAISRVLGVSVGWLRGSRTTIVAAPPRAKTVRGV